jgi:(S)-2-hydroxy-acid oxidase
MLGALAAVPAVLKRSIALGDTPPPSGVTPPSRAYTREPPPITAADQVLSVMDFEPLARDALPPAHYGYLATGADDDATVVRNHEAFAHVEIRSRRFVDVSKTDTSLTVYGTRWATPIYLSAVSSMRAFHAGGEVAVARAAATRSAHMMLSTGSSDTVEAVAEARKAPVWYQLYPTDGWAVTEALVRRAERAGCPAIVLTVDNLRGRNSETFRRATRIDNRECVACHVNNSHDMWRKAPIFAGLDVSRVTTFAPDNITVGYLDRLRKLVSGKLLVKGVVTGEDAAVAIDHGADGIVLSNHGGRSEEALRATIDCLPEVAGAVRGRVPVLIDGGVRRGTDVFKALALGATAVGIGRPQAWGLAAFGQSGVESVLDILNRELRTIMRQAGTPTLASITRERVVPALYR